MEVCNSSQTFFILKFFCVPNGFFIFSHLFPAYRGFVARKEYQNAKHNQKIEKYIIRLQASKNWLLSWLLMFYPNKIRWSRFFAMTLAHYWLCSFTLSEVSFIHHIAVCSGWSRLVYFQPWWFWFHCWYLKAA